MKRSVLALTSPGWAILVAVLALTCIGTASIFVIDTAYVAGHDGPRNAGKHVLFTLVGMALAVGVMRIGYRRIGRYAIALFVLALIALVPLLIAHALRSSFGGLTAPRNGAYRWIHLPGFQFQPSEVMKLAFILALAWYLRYRRNYRRFGGLLKPFVVATVPLALILLEPDLGTVILLTVVLFGMMFVAGAKVKHLLLIALAGMALAPIGWYRLKPYQRLRVSAVLLQSNSLRDAIKQHPDRFGFIATPRQAIEWSASSGYQLIASKRAIGSGGLLGFGWGKGVYVENKLLPDSHNDFIFAIVGHQFGLAGCVLVLLCYLVIVVSGIRIAAVTAEPFGRLLVVGIVTLIATQVIINTSMTVGLMPITGMTLPFVSAGGSSLLTNYMALGLMIGVAQCRPFLLAGKPFNFARRRRRTHLAEMPAATVLRRRD